MQICAIKNAPVNNSRQKADYNRCQSTSFTSLIDKWKNLSPARQNELKELLGGILGGLLAVSSAVACFFHEEIYKLYILIFTPQ